jgi:hypothetical protein
MVKKKPRTPKAEAKLLAQVSKIDRVQARAAKQTAKVVKKSALKIFG